jgi:DNA-binding MarR family transcriptional regulator
VRGGNHRIAPRALADTGAEMTLRATENSEQLPAGFNELDPLLQHRSRLGAMVLLSNTDAISFSRLKELLNETDGNLGAQLRKLEDAGYLTVKKEFAGRKPISWYSLPAAGRKALQRHLEALQAVYESAGINRGTKVS